MTNPADELADMLERFRVETDNQSVTARRRASTPEGMSVLEWTQVASSLLSEVERALVALEDDGTEVSMFRESSDAWAAAVYMPNQAWNTQTAAGTGISDTDLRFLRGVGRILDRAKIGPTVGEDQTAQLLETLDEAHNLVKAAELDEPIRLYLLGLIDEAMHVTRNADVFPKGRIRQISMELGGAMMVTSTIAGRDGDPAERGGKFARLGWKVLTAVGINTASHGAIEGAEKAAKALSELVN